MSFLETPRFPDQVAFWAVGGAGYNTTIIVVNSGYEQRNINWSQALAKYDISEGMRTLSDVAATIAFFRSVKGKAHGFRFKDFQDYQVTTANGILGEGVGNSTATYQMKKVYAAGALNEHRIITKPVAATVNVYKNAVLQVLNTDYTFSATTGIVTFLGSPPTNSDTLTWAGEFDVPVRFDIDEMRGTPNDGGLWTWETIPIVEIRV